MSPGARCLLGHKLTLQLHKYISSYKVRNILPAERQRPRDDQISGQRFFILPLGIGPNDRGQSFKVVIQATMFLSELVFKHTSYMYVCVPRQV